MTWAENSTVRATGRLVIVAVFTATAIQNCASSLDSGYRAPGIVVAAVAGALIAWQRVPWYVAPVVITAATGIFGWVLLPLLALVLFDLTVQRRTNIALLFSAIAIAVTAFAPAQATPQAIEISAMIIILALPMLAGMWVGHRRKRIAVLNDEVARLKHERSLGEDRARAKERARIAAEMHDVLAHRLSIIALHSGVLEAKSATLPAPIGDRLTLLRNASTQALSDLRDLLGALHESPEDLPTRPVLVDVDDLTEQARAAGQDVTLVVDGTSADAPVALQLAVQRIVLESLTNARKHAVGGSVTVRLAYGPPVTTVSVDNTLGSASSDAAPSGYGLVGLRERVLALGGEFEAGPIDEGGWRVSARIPHPNPVEQDWQEK